MNEQDFLIKTIELAKENVLAGGWPFSAMLVRDKKVIASACNGVHTSNDPTDHAEIAAIRLASEKLQTPDLKGCTMYIVAPPCPMCMGAIILSGIDTIKCVLSIEDKDTLLPTLPSSTGLYEKVAKSIDGDYPKLIIDTEHSERASQVLKEWNDTNKN